MRSRDVGVDRWACGVAATTILTPWNVDMFPCLVEKGISLEIRWEIVENSFLIHAATVLIHRARRCLRLCLGGRGAPCVACREG